MDKTTYYLNIAKEVSRKSTCLRRQYGAIIVKDDEIIATGYNGAPRGVKHCCEVGCARETVPHGTRYEICRSVHAEMNCVISASRRDMINSTMYLYGEENGKSIDNIDSCSICKRLIINAGIKRVYMKTINDYKVVNVSDWINPSQKDTDGIGNNLEESNKILKRNQVKFDLR